MSEDKTIYIPIGVNCDACTHIVRTSKRKEAYPFDWVISPIQSIIDCIQNDFENFLVNYTVLKSKQFHNIRDHHDESFKSKQYTDHIACTRYNMVFIHDFETKKCSDPNYFNRVLSKYQRRIQRFRDVCNSDSKVIFVVNSPLRINTQALTGFVTNHMINLLKIQKANDETLMKDFTTTIRSKYPSLNFEIEYF